MTTLERLHYLNTLLLDEMPQNKEHARHFENTPNDQRALLRSLMNIRPPKPISEAFLKIQDEVLQEEIAEKGIVQLSELQACKQYKNIYLWQGDITRLAVDAIVNAANSALLGCFAPCHNCIDNIIHSFAGVQLRLECYEIMQKQGHEEATGKAKITKAYNLPSAHVIHTVGPIIGNEPTPKDCELLESAYKECFNLAVEKKLHSMAFCCISTGEFRFPNDKAAHIAVQTITKLLQQTDSDIKVIFNVFKDVDYAIYKQLLG